jgi:hypothetical protein
VNMIINPEKFVEKMQDWLNQQLKEANKDKFITFDRPEVPHFYVELIEKIVPKFITLISADSLSDENSFERAAFCNHWAETNNALIISTLSLAEIFARSYHKYTSGLADLFPFGQLKYDELVSLAKYFNLNHDNKKPLIITKTNIDLIEWAYRENNASQIISKTDRPEKNALWFRYTIPQKEVISLLHQRDKSTKHKELRGLIFPARNSEFVQ